jgi:hypothetical protein
MVGEALTTRAESRSKDGGFEKAKAKRTKA